MPISEAKRRANDKWNQKNKDKQIIYSTHAASRRFIRDFATTKDLDELDELIKQRRLTLKEK